MTTVVVHGTLMIRAAKKHSWWWDSWREGGFLHSLSEGMELVSGWQDVWRVNGTYVSDVPELNPKRSLWIGRMGQIAQQQGHFIWVGADAGFARDAGARALVDYINLISELTDEPIRIVAHSHGCNIVKNASSHKRLAPRVFFEKAVFLACPHFFAKGVDGRQFTYRLDPDRFGQILNLYSMRDTVQVGFADSITGPPGARFADWAPPDASRCEMDPRAQGLYEDYEFETAATGVAAHTVMHGSGTGGLSGMWLNGSLSFRDLLKRSRFSLPPIPKDDTGA